MRSPQVIGKYPKVGHSLAAASLHLSLLPSALFERGLVAWVLPLLLWAVLRRWSPLVDHHGLRAINWGMWLAVASATTQGLVWLNPRSEQGSTVILGALMILWALVALRRAWRAWQGKEILQARVSLIG